MATTLYFRGAPWGSGNEYGKWSPGTNLANLAGSNVGWSVFRWHTTRGAASDNVTRTTIAGPTQGLEMGSAYNHWNCAPFTADTTISGTITANLRFATANVTANTISRVIVERVDTEGVIQDTIVDTTDTVEHHSATTEQAYNWTASVTSTLVHKGEFLRCRVVIDDTSVGDAMQSGHVITFYNSGPTAGASGDSYITFSTTLPLPTDFPTAGTVVYPTSTDSDVNPGGVTAKRAWTTAGFGSITATLNSVAGWTPPLQWTNSAGGTAIEWFTPQLEAVTLGGSVKIDQRGLESAAPVNAAPRCEIAVCNSDGTSPVIWGVRSSPTEFGTTDANQVYVVSGDDVSIIQGQRIRIRFYADEPGPSAMGSGGSISMTYNANVSGAGFTFLTFPVTLVEFVGGTVVNVAQVTETDSVQTVATAQTYALAQVSELSSSTSFFIEDTVTGLSATPLSATSIALDWDPFPGATGYDVERDGTIIAEFLPPDPTYLDTGLTPETSYSYRVRAVI